MDAALPPRLETLRFSDIPGWDDDALSEFWPAFRLSALSVATAQPSLRTAREPEQALGRALRDALSVPVADARSFLEARWTPYRIAADGFVTAYYEPIVSGALARSDAFRAPILARPRDLDAVTPYPDRRAIRRGAIAGQTSPVVWLRDDVDVFLIQVQGSARVKLADGQELRLVYDGRNGRPYSSIGRLLIERGAIASEAMSLAALKGWLRENGAGSGGPADTIMDTNESYVFFRAEPVRNPSEGPIGGHGVPLTARRSIAIDRTRWSYGLPFWIDAALPEGRFRHLTVSQDTGSAIVGPSRADLFFGSGPEAGDRAGLVRHPATLCVLLPNEATP